MIKNQYANNESLNLHNTYVNTPWVSGRVYHCLQISGNILPVRQQLRQGLGAKDIPQSRGRQ